MKKYQNPSWELTKYNSYPPPAPKKFLLHVQENQCLTLQSCYFGLKITMKCLGHGVIDRYREKLSVFWFFNCGRKKEKETKEAFFRGSLNGDRQKQAGRRQDWFGRKCTTVEKSVQFYIDDVISPSFLFCCFISNFLTTTAARNVIVITIVLVQS